MEYQDLVYFGNDWDVSSAKLQNEFIAEIKAKFPNIVLNDAYDTIKGYRQEIFLDQSDSDNYWAWLIANGWANCSLGGQLMMLDENEKERFLTYLELAKNQYPENFKKDI